MAGENPKSGSGGGSGIFKFYAVRSGKVPGIYTDWPSAQKQITGWTKPKHKCFSTRAEAQRFLEEDETPQHQGGLILENEANAPSSEVDSVEPATKKVKKTTAATSTPKRSKPSSEDFSFDFEGYEPGVEVPPGIEDGFDPNVLLEPDSGNVVFKSRAQNEATKLHATRPAANSALRIFTDGSSLKNGQKGAFAGIGVYFGPSDARYSNPQTSSQSILLLPHLTNLRNLSEPLPGPRQTNQRAELTAILRALDTVPKDRDVVIVTDSRYSIDCVTKWSISWRKNGWKTSQGKPVENRDIVESVLSRIEARAVRRVQTAFEWIKGHSDQPGNVEADRLAVDGARRAVALPSAN